MSDAHLRKLESEYAATQDETVLEKIKREWARSACYRVCGVCDLRVPESAWIEHELSHRPQTTPGGLRVVTIPATGVVGGRPGKFPLYDRVVIEPTLSQVEFFTSFDRRIWNTNVFGSGNQFPPGQTFYLHGLSLVPDARANRDDVLRVYDQGFLEFRTAQATLGEWPARVVVDDQPHVEEQDADDLELARCYEAGEIMPEPEQAGRLVRLRNPGPVRDVTIAGRPLTLTGGSAFQFRLGLGEPVETPTPIMLVLYGILVRGISG